MLLLDLSLELHLHLLLLLIQVELCHDVLRNDLGLIRLTGGEPHDEFARRTGVVVEVVEARDGAQSRFARLAAAGLATTIFFYVAINMAMVTGLAPVVGIPLPFISQGGSSLIMLFAALGLLQSVLLRHRQIEF